MRVRALSPTGDYTFGQSQANFLVNSAAAVAQLIQTALQLMQGEWFLNLSVGTPYGTQILGFGTTGLYDAAIQAVIQGVQGVQQITDYSSTLDNQTRQLSVSATVLTAFGPVPITAVVGAPAQPPIPLNFAGTACDGQALFTWSPVPGTTYNLYRGDVASGIVPMPVAAGVTGGSVAVSAANGLARYYVLCALIGGISSEPTAEVSVTPVALNAPVVTPTPGAGSVALVWTASAGAVAYNVYQGTAAGEEGTDPVATVTGLGTTITGLTAGQPYYFTVEAVNACGETVTSAEVTATPS